MHNEKILKIGDDYIMLITTQIADKIIDKLNMYKLASDVNVTLDDNMSSFVEFYVNSSGA